MINIALDFDNTFDRMPAVWIRFIRDARNCGCRVFIVSSRMCSCDADGRCENCNDLRDFTGRAMNDCNLVVHDSQPGSPPIETFTFNIILTSGQAKKWFLKKRGIDVDIWIDDAPESILQGK